jgi:hypothetical protein
MIFLVAVSVIYLQMLVREKVILAHFNPDPHSFKTLTKATACS